VQLREDVDEFLSQLTEEGLLVSDQA